MEFDDDEEKNYWTNIQNGCINDQSDERKVFKVNLDKLIAKNIKLTGKDPRINGPPDHVKN